MAVELRQVFDFDPFVDMPILAEMPEDWLEFREANISLIYLVAESDKPGRVLASTNYPMDQQQRILYAAVQVSYQTAAVWDILGNFCPSIRNDNPSLEEIHSAFRAGNFGKMVTWPWVERHMDFC